MSKPKLILNLNQINYEFKETENEEIYRPFDGLSCGNNVF